MTDTAIRFRRTIDWKAGIVSGLVAGIVFMMVEMMLVGLVQGESPWAPPRMMAAMLLNKSVLPPPADFSMLAMGVAMMIHLPLSIVYALVIGRLVQRLDMTSAVLAGAAFGLAIYLVNFYLIAPLLFPWFTMARNWISIVTHVLFGMVAAGSYLALQHRDPARAP